MRAANTIVASSTPKREMPARTSPAIITKATAPRPAGWSARASRSTATNIAPLASARETSSRSDP